jgi:hypothetical protein
VCEDDDAIRIVRHAEVSLDRTETGLADDGSDLDAKVVFFHGHHRAAPELL